MPTDSISKVLSIESATRRSSVALFIDGQPLAIRIAEREQLQSNTLLANIDEVLRESGVDLNELDLVAVACGPGSFTGLRSALATVKAFAVTLGIHCIGVPTLHAIALAAGQSAATLAMLPAGRGELFAQVLRVAADRRVTELSQPVHLPPDEVFTAALKFPDLILIGEATSTHAASLGEFAERHLIRLDAHLLKGWRTRSSGEPLCREVAMAGVMLAQHGASVGPEYLRAIYVRPSDAELNLKR